MTTPKTTGTGKRPPARCGTRGGFQKHRRNKQDPCDACREAERVYHKEHMAQLRERERAARDQVVIPPKLFAELYWTATDAAIEQLDALFGRERVDEIIKLADQES